MKMIGPLRGWPQARTIEVYYFDAQFITLIYMWQFDTATQFSVA